MTLSETLAKIRKDLEEGKYSKRTRHLFDPVPEFQFPQVHDLPMQQVYVERYDGTQSE